MTNNLLNGRKGQLTIFIIIALVIAAGIVTYFIVRSQIEISEVPQEFIPVYDYYQSCIENNLANAISLSESRGGRIYTGEFIPGSSYAPAGNQLNFLGIGVPYWFYITGNGIARENVPLKGDIEKDLENYVESSLGNCNLDKFYEQGFYINIGEPTAKFSIRDNNVGGSVSISIAASKGEQSALKKDFEVEVESKLGKFYKKAVEIYNAEREDAFIENYSVDVLRNYAPVDGVEISCSGKIWKARDVAEDLKRGLEANIGALKLEGNYYSLAKKENDYFVIDSLAVDNGEGASFIYSGDWPSRIEIDGEGAEGELLVAKPVGNQNGLGIMGFCYAPYHFVYDLVFPVMVQIYDGDEIFQFPVISVVDNNLPRQGIYSSLDYEPETDICKLASKEAEINVYDVNLNRVDANLSYSCLNQECALGETENGQLNVLVPGCYNGYLAARADSFDEKKQVFSSNEESRADIIVDRNYEIAIELVAGGKSIGNKTAIISFTKDGKTRSVAMPETNKVKLGEGLYEISVQVYDSSGIVIPESTRTQCVEVPRGGVLGVFGATREQCFEVTLPKTTIESALAGGGKTEEYIFEDSLKTGKMRINVDSLPKPTTIEQMQINYELYENGVAEVSF